MTDETFRRLFWSAALLFSVAVWAFAIIGLRAAVADPACLSVWTAAERAF
jgi:hypothetical protein